VIRDVAGSYRRALQATVEHYCGWRPEPGVIDALKGEGRWNNDWDASLELLRRRQAQAGGNNAFTLPPRPDLVEVFSRFYFGEQPDGDPRAWTGYITDEPLLVERQFFTDLTAMAVTWGFVSGAEPPSARFLLSQRLGLESPALIAMGDAPDKPDPTGLLRLAQRLLQAPLGAGTPPIAYLGDTVADVQTVVQARAQCPEQTFVSLAVAPPHLHGAEQTTARRHYEQRLQDAGADRVLPSTTAALDWCHALEPAAAP